MSRAQAIAELSQLHVEYCPILDALLAAPSGTVDAIVADEQRLGKRISDLGPVAFGPPKGARLKIMRPFKEEELDPNARHWLEERRWHNEPHKIAVLCCAVRSHRLGKYLDGVDTEGRSNFSVRALKMWAAIEAKDGPPKGHGAKAARYSVIAGKLECSPDTVKQALQREQRKRKGTVPK